MLLGRDPYADKVTAAVSHHRALLVSMLCICVELRLGALSMLPAARLTALGSVAKVETKGAAPCSLRVILDLNLLTVFEAIYETGTASGAADRLALSQSAASHSLSRLREACRDDLFVLSSPGSISSMPGAQDNAPC